jgi:hypothetical protein
MSGFRVICFAFCIFLPQLCSSALMPTCGQDLGLALTNLAPKITFNYENAV